MYLHLTEKDKTQLVSLTEKHDEIMLSLEETVTKYPDIQLACQNHFKKLLKKGRLNIPLGKEVFSLNYSDKDGTFIIKVVHITKNNLPYLHTSIQEHSKEFGESSTDTYDRIDVIESATLILRVLYKLSEMILKSMRRYETDAAELAEIMELADSVGIGRTLTTVDVIDILHTSENRLDAAFIAGHELKEKLTVAENESTKSIDSKATGIYVEEVTHELSLLDKFKKYRSAKEIVHIVTNFHGERIEDSLLIEKNELSGKFHYTLRLTKVDKLKDGTYDIVLVNTSLEVSQTAYTTVLADHLNALLTTVENRLYGFKTA